MYIILYLIKYTLNMFQPTIFVLILSVIFVNATKQPSDRYSYVLETKEDGVIMDTSPMGFLERTNKSYGAGYVIGINDVNNLFTDTLYNLRATTSKPYYYFYRDDSKYYIRDDKCNFVCLNPCGEVYTSPFRLQHYCKFKVKQDHSGKFKFYIVSNGPILNYRAMEFLSSENIVRGRVNIKNETDIPALFHLKGPLKIQNKCTAITKVRQFNLDARPDPTKPDNRCDRLDYRSVAQNKVSVVLPIKQQSMLFYNLKIEDQYVNGKGKLVNVASLDTVFLKQYVKPNVYTFVNTRTCSYLCLNKCGNVYVSTDFNKDCNVAVEQTLDKNEHYIRFTNNNYYLTFNDTTNDLGYSRGAKSKVALKETIGPGITCRVNTNTLGVSDDTCAHSLGNKLVISLPPLFMFLLFNYNNNKTIVIDNK